MSLLGRPGPVHAVPKALPGLDAWHVSVPDEAGTLGKIDGILVAGAVEEAELDSRRHLGEEGEVHAGAVVLRSQGIGSSGPHLHGPKVERSAPSVERRLLPTLNAQRSK